MEQSREMHYREGLGMDRAALEAAIREHAAARDEETNSPTAREANQYILDGYGQAWEERFGQTVETQTAEAQAEAVQTEEAPAMEAAFAEAGNVETMGALTAVHNLALSDLTDLAKAGGVSIDDLKALSAERADVAGDVTVVMSESAPQSGKGSVASLTAVVPDNLDDFTWASLDANGVNIVTYPAGDHGAKLEALNGLETVQREQQRQQQRQQETEAEIQRRAAEQAVAQATAQLVQEQGIGLIKNEHSEMLSKEQRETFDLLARAAGVSVVLEEIGRENVNGWYQDGVIHISVKAKNPFQVVLQHELTHRLMETSPSAYREYRDYAVETVMRRDKKSQAELVIELQEKYRKNGIELSNEEALDEAAAEFAGDLVLDVSLYRSMAKAERGLATRMLDALKRFLRRVQRWFEGRDMREKFARENYGTDYKTAQSAVELWEKALEATANQAEGQRAGAEGGQKYSFAEQRVPTYDELIAKPDMQVVDIRTEETGNYKARRKAFMQSSEMQEICRTPVVNRDTGEAVFITPATFTHSFSNSGNEQLPAAIKIRELVENAVLTHAEEDRNERAATTGVYTLFAAAWTDSGVLPVKIKIKEQIVDGRGLPRNVEAYFATEGAQDEYAAVYDNKVLLVESIEKEDASSSALTADGKAPAGKYPSASSVISVADLIGLVKGDAAKYLPGKARYSVDEGEKQEEKPKRKKREDSDMIPKGENPARDVKVPKKTEHGKTMYTARTIMEAKVTTEEGVEALQQHVKDGGFSYKELPDDTAKQRATEIIAEQGGFREALYEWSKDDGRFTKTDVAVGWLLYDAAISAGDTKLAVRIATDIANRVHDAAQAVQAVRILKKLSPEYQLYSIERTVQRIQQDLNERYGVAEEPKKKNAKELVKDLAKDITGEKAETEEAEAEGQTQRRKRKTSETAEQAEEAEAEGQVQQRRKRKTSEAAEQVEEAEAEETVRRKKRRKRRKRRKKGAPQLKISEGLKHDFMTAKTEAQRDAIKRKMYQEAAQQLPVTWTDRWNAWRYFAMLFNPRTHVRNVLGNAIFLPVRVTKDTIATLLEAGAGGIDKIRGRRLQKKGKPYEKMGRTKAFLNYVKASDRALRSAAAADYVNVVDIIQAGGKFGDEINEEQKIRAERPMFTSKRKVVNAALKPLEALRNVNTTLLDKEDTWFSKPAYTQALAGYLKANGISAEEFSSGKLSEKVMAKARAYAISEAQKATYRDTNEFSKLISEIGKRRIDEKNGWQLVDRAAGAVIEGVLPFKKTPANILVRGVAEYSPIGVLRSIKQFIFDVRKGRKTAAEALDMLASGLTGTGLVGLGVLLSHLGLLSGAEDDDELREFGELRGEQSYALNIGDKSYTVDWMAPAALPVFVGVEIAEVFRDPSGGRNAKTVMEAVGNISEPMLELSMLSSLNELLDDVSYSDAKLMTILSSAATSYLMQAVPSVFGSIERISETQRYSTYADKDNAILTEDMQYLIASLGNRSPGEYKQIPFVDAWGRTEDTGSFGWRLVANLISPGYLSELQETPVDEELLRLYNGGNTGVFPDRVKHSVTVQLKYLDPNATGERHLTAEEYVKYATVRGQKSLATVQSVIESDWYGALSDERKADAIEYVYEYADYVAKQETFPGYAADSWVNDALAAEQNGIQIETYITAKAAAKNFEGVLDENGESITNSRGLRIMQSVYALKGLSDSQKRELLDALAFSKTIGQTIKDYTSEQVNEVIAAGAYAYEYEKLAEVVADGASMELYVEFKKLIKGVKGDPDPKNPENTISGSKKAKILAIIDAMDITDKEKDALYKAEYSESTLYKDAPWH